MKINKLIKIFIINTLSLLIIAKIIPTVFTNLSERTFERILLLYFLIFNIILFIKTKNIKEDQKEG